MCWENLKMNTRHNFISTGTLHVFGILLILTSQVLEMGTQLKNNFIGIWMTWKRKQKFSLFPFILLLEKIQNKIGMSWKGSPSSCPHFIM